MITEAQKTTRALLRGKTTPEEYAGYWGCGPAYDRAPRLHGDGCKFYNFAVDGHDPEFLKEFIPAIERTIQGQTDPEEVKGLKFLLEICRARLN